jgi:hypothetical protein
MPAADDHEVDVLFVQVLSESRKRSNRIRPVGPCHFSMGVDSHGDLAKALSELAFGEERKEEVAEVLDVERPDDPDSRRPHGPDPTVPIRVR